MTSGSSSGLVASCQTWICWIPARSEYEANQRPLLIVYLCKELYPHCSVLFGSRNRFKYSIISTIIGPNQIEMYVYKPDIISLFMVLTTYIENINVHEPFWEGGGRWGGLFKLFYSAYLFYVLYFKWRSNQ